MGEGKGSIVIISGPVGAGKTALAKALVELSPAPIAAIEGDEFWKCIAKIDGPPHKTFRVIMSSMIAAAVPFAVSGFEVVVDFSIPPWYLDNCLKIAGRREIPLRYVVVLPSQAVCASRAAARPEGAIENYGPYEELYRDFLDAGECAISDDECDPRTLAKRVREGLDAGKYVVEKTNPD